MIVPKSELQDAIKIIDGKLFNAFCHMMSFLFCIVAFYPIIYLMSLINNVVGETIYCALGKKAENFNNFVDARNNIVKQLKEIENEKNRR